MITVGGVPAKVVRANEHRAIFVIPARVGLGSTKVTVRKKREHEGREEENEEESDQKQDDYHDVGRKHAPPSIGFKPELGRRLFSWGGLPRSSLPCHVADSSSHNAF